MLGVFLKKIGINSFDFTIEDKNYFELLASMVPGDTHHITNELITEILDSEDPLYFNRMFVVYVLCHYFMLLSPIEDDPEKASIKMYSIIKDFSLIYGLPEPYRNTAVSCWRLDQNQIVLPLLLKSAVIREFAFQILDGLMDSPHAAYQYYRYMSIIPASVTECILAIHALTASNNCEECLDTIRGFCEMENGTMEQKKELIMEFAGVMEAQGSTRIAASFSSLPFTKEEERIVMETLTDKEMFCMNRAINKEIIY